MNREALARHTLDSDGARRRVWRRRPSADSGELSGSISGSVTVEGLNAEPGDPGGILVYLKERPDKNAVTTAVG